MDNQANLLDARDLIKILQIQIEKSLEHCRETNQKIETKRAA
jgi:hypothetical protein